jgi:tetratricopeptide (TPR) repeat protein
MPLHDDSLDFLNDVLQPTLAGFLKNWQTAVDWLSYSHDTTATTGDRFVLARLRPCSFCFASIPVALLLVVSAALHAGQAEDDPALQKARNATGADAVAQYRALSEKYPDSGAVWYEFGNVAYDNNLVKEGAGAYERAVALGYKPALSHMRLGKALAKLKEFARAESEFRKSLEIDAGGVAAKFGLASALFSQEKSSEALPIFEELARRDDEWGGVSKEYFAQSLFDVGRFSDAAAQAVSLLQKSPDDPSLHWLLARSLYKQKKFSQALAEFRWVAEHDTGRKEAATFYIGASLEGLGQTREAEKSYREIAKGDSTWAKAARDANRGLAGKAYFFTLDSSAGYETGIASTDDFAATKGKDGFLEIYANAAGRVYRGDRFSIWLGGSHYGLSYLDLKENDYTLDSGKVEFRIPHVGPFSELSIRYKLNYSRLDYSSYQREHVGEAVATYIKGPDRVRIGAFGEDSTYFGQYHDLSGPQGGVFAEYRRLLPKWDHEVQVRASAEERFSEADRFKRLSERISLQYRAKVWNIVYGQARVQYRRDDFPDSDEVGKHRTDHRLTGEVRFDAQVQKHVFINWGYLYESQDSRQADQEYGRHQVSAGFTLTF